MNTRAIARVIACMVLFIAAGIINPWTISKLTGNPIIGMTPKLLYGLLAFCLFCLFAGSLFIVKPEPCLKLITMVSRPAAKYLISETNRLRILLLLPVFCFFCYFYYCIIREHQLPIFNFVIIAFILQYSILSSLLIYLLFSALKRVKYIFFIFALLYMIVFVADCISITNGGGRFNFRMISWLSEESFFSFITVPLILKLIVIGILIATTLIMIYKKKMPHYSYMAFGKRALVLALAFYVNPGHWFLTGTTALLSQEDRTLWRCDIDSCEQYLTDPMLHLPSTIINHMINKNNFVDSEYFKKMKINHLTNKKSVFTKKEHQINKIIFIMVESFSLNYSKIYNTHIPVSITPFIDSLSESTRPIWTCSSPTTMGIATHFCSHPNASEIISMDYPHSVVRALKNNGWRTVFFQSPKETFDEGIKHFSDLGFTEHYGSQWQLEHGNAQYVKQWGACDRITFQEIGNYLDRHRNERIFISGLTIDTHFPVGRLNYGDLQYPDEPQWIKADPAYLLLRSVYRFDHDLSRFVTQLKEKQLLGDDTVLIITADHSCPPFPLLESRLGLNDSRYEKIPWIAISGDHATVIPTAGFGSQLDSAPTIAYLAGIAPDPAWWGDGLQYLSNDYPLISCTDEKPMVLFPGQNQFQALNNKELRDLSRTFVYDDACPQTRKPQRH